MPVAVLSRIISVFHREVQGIVFEKHWYFRENILKELEVSLLIKCWVQVEFSVEYWQSLFHSFISRSIEHNQKVHT
jgi:hypothetical protein